MLGGQHITAAIKMLYKDFISKGYTEENIPIGIKNVACQIIRAGAPLQLCKWAAGQHQHSQHQHTACNTEDVARTLIVAIEEKFSKTFSVSLSDEDLFFELETTGLVSTVKAPGTEKQTKISAEQLTVC